MFARGKMSRDAVNAALSALVEPAIMGLKKTNLSKAHLRDVPVINYTAATLVMLAAQIAVDLDIFEIESRLAQIDPEQRENHPLHSFTNVLIQAGASQAACKAIEDFITSEHSDPRTALIDLFKVTGVTYHIHADRFIISL